MSQLTAIAAPVAEAQDVTRDFHTGSGTVHVLRGIDLAISPGEFVALRGRSGSGKTTLLNILVGLDDPTQGQVSVLGQAERGSACLAALQACRPAFPERPPLPLAHCAGKCGGRAAPAGNASR